MRQSIERQGDSAVPAATFIVLLLVLLLLAAVSLGPVTSIATILFPTMLTPLSPVTVNSTHTLQTLIPLTMSLLAMPAPLHTLSPRIVPLPTVPTPLPIAPFPIPSIPLTISLPADLACPLVHFLAENILALRAIRRIETRVRFGVRADIHAGAALVVAGLPVGDVADAHLDCRFF